MPDEKTDKVISSMTCRAPQWIEKCLYDLLRQWQQFANFKNSPMLPSRAAVLKDQTLQILWAYEVSLEAERIKNGKEKPE